jgi:hypothetical protein
VVSPGRSDGSCVASPPTVSLAREMGTTQGADAPEGHAPIGVVDGGTGGSTIGRAGTDDAGAA